MRRGEWDPEDLDNLATRSSWLRLKRDGEERRVTFIPPPVHYRDHYRRGVCPRGKDDPKEMCPVCMEGQYPTSRGAVTVYDFESNSTMIWQAPRGWFRTVYEEAECQLAKVGAAIQDKAFDLKRLGEWGDTSTTYSLGFPQELTDAEREAVNSATPFSVDQLMGKLVAENGRASNATDDPGHNDEDVPF